MVTLAVALPSVTTAMKTYKTSSDVRNLAAQIALAKMRAAADFTDARINFNAFTKNAGTGTYQYQIELWNSTSGTWQTDQIGSANIVQNLSTSTAFGFGSIGTPAGSQSAPITNWSTIEFNSRGVPVVGSNGGVAVTTTAGSLTSPTALNAVYLNNGNGAYYAITVSPSGNIQMWQWGGTTWSQFY